MLAPRCSTRVDSPNFDCITDFTFLNFSWLLRSKGTIFIFESSERCAIHFSCSFVSILFQLGFRIAKLDCFHPADPRLFRRPACGGTPPQGTGRVGSFFSFLGFRAAESDYFRSLSSFLSSSASAKILSRYRSHFFLAASSGMPAMASLSFSSSNIMYLNSLFSESTCHGLNVSR